MTRRTGTPGRTTRRPTIRSPPGSRPERRGDGATSISVSFKGNPVRDHLASRDLASSGSGRDETPAQEIRSAQAPFSGRPYAEETRRSIDQEGARLLLEAEDTAAGLLRGHRDTLDRVIGLLLERETIDGADLAGIVGTLAPAYYEPDGAPLALTMNRPVNRHRGEIAAPPLVRERDFRFFFRTNGCFIPPREPAPVVTRIRE
jgi:hypothetical protein